MPARRGGALVALGGIVASWLVLRLILWAPPFPVDALSGVATLEDNVPGINHGQRPLAEAVQTPLGPPGPHMEASLSQGSEVSSLRAMETRLSVTPTAHQTASPRQSPLKRRDPAGTRQLIAQASLLELGLRDEAGRKPPLSGPAIARQQAGDMGAPPAIFTPQEASEIRGTGTASPWSMDAWALWREENDSPLLSGRPSYGRSQLGAVVRYSLAPSNSHALQIHMRGSLALEGRKEREAALGTSMRPVPGVPVRLAAEARVSETDRGTELRGAAFAVSEFPPLDLPGSLRADVYMQGGYVTGDFATPFVDGQARVTRALIRSDELLLSAGGGVWGGAQKDAQRLDLGPSAAVNFRIGPVRGRATVDYRFRVAGDAEPASGPALTLSAGF